MKLIIHLFLISLVAFSVIGCDNASTSRTPSVSINEPEDGATIMGKCGINFKLEVTAYDDYDEYFVYNIYLKKTSDTEYSFIGSSYALVAFCEEDGSSFDTTQFDNGQYHLKATAEDSHGKVGEAVIKVNISN